MTLVATVLICDHRGCPAAAVEELMIREQDFHFCRHHAYEMWLAALIDPGVDP